MISDATGMPFTVVWLRIGTMSSPWPPSTSACTLVTETSSSQARNVPVAGRVEHAGHADDLPLREAGDLLHQGHHRVERIGDHDDERLRRMLLQRLGDGLDDLRIDADEIVAAHAGLASHAGGDDADVGAREVGVVVAALDLDVVSLDGTGGGEIERLALRQALDHVEQRDVAERLERAEVGERAADHASADEGDLVTCHAVMLLRGCRRGIGSRGRGPVQTRKRRRCKPPRGPASPGD